jgi:predicted  nucleic acid-binding Zn-ribbon protein
MAPDEPDRRLRELEREFKGLLASYGAVMQSVARLDERADASERDRREMREAMTQVHREFREGLAAFDKSCTAKVDEVGRKVELSAQATRREIREDLKDRQWSPMAKSAPYAAAIAATGAFIVALLKT